MNKRIGWIDNHWSSLSNLSLPIDDRGLNYGDGIFETILIWEGKPRLLKEHLNRWRHSAQELGMDLPPQEEMVYALINEGINLCALTNKTGSVRLNWSRGGNLNRGINIPSYQSDKSSHRFWLEINAITTNFKPITTFISRNEKRNSSSKVNSHKTFAYNQSIQARQEAQVFGYDDALMESTTGEICCGSVANLIVKRNDKYLTPGLKSGCLPGIMRQQGINLGIIQEKTINTQPELNDEWLLINSLGCRAISKVNNIVLKPFSNPKSFWLSLYQL